MRSYIHSFTFFIHSFFASPHRVTYCNGRVRILCPLVCQTRSIRSITIDLLLSFIHSLYASPRRVTCSIRSMLSALDCKPTSGHLLCCSIATQSYLLMSALSRGVYQSDTANFTQVACAHPVFSIVRIAHPSGFRSPGSVILCLLTAHSTLKCVILTVAFG